MTDRNNTRAVRLHKADQAAKANFEKEDISSAIGTCPARQTEVFVVPTRYALAELPAEHDCVQAPCTTKSHAIALRRLRPGYLYLWHQSGPLKRYAVAVDGKLLEQELDAAHTEVTAGTLAGFALNKTHDAWLLYTEIPLPPAAHKRLADNTGERKLRMRQISLTQVALHLKAKHCPPLDNAEQVLAELMPKVRDWGLAHNYAVNGEQHRKHVKALGQRATDNPTSENTEAYAHSATWLGEAEQAAARNPEVAESAPGEWSAQPWDIPATDSWIRQAKSQTGALWGVFAAVDDSLGVLRDLNHEQELTESRHETWLGKNAHRTAIAGFIRSLTQESSEEVAGMLSYRYREHDIQLTPEQGESILKCQRRLDELFKEEQRINQERGRRYSHAQADTELAKVHADVTTATAPVRAFIPSELHTQAEYVVREYRKEKVTNRTNSRGSAQISKRIALWKMDDWLDNQAPQHYASVESRHSLLYADRESFLPLHAGETWFADHHIPEHQEWLNELALACLSALCVREQGAIQAYNLLSNPVATDAFSMLLQGWSPILTELVNDISRAGELENALAADNLAKTRSILNSLIDPAEVAALSRLAENLQGAWAQTVTRIGAGVIKLAGGDLKPLMGMLLILRLSDAAQFSKTVAQGSTVWKVSGQLADGLKTFTDQVAAGIKQGTLKQVRHWDGAKRAGGVLSLAVLALNIVNAQGHGSSSAALDAEGERRQAERLSAYLYTGAALSSVMQGFVLNGLKKDELVRGRIAAPTLTLFGGIVGVLSATAAAQELVSLQKQINQAQASIDPYLDMRRSAVKGQMAFYGAQGVLGFTLTGMRMAGMLTTAEAIQYFRVGMAPLNWLLLAAGAVYLYAWWHQETELQSFLSQCCWSAETNRRRWDDSPQGQLDELLALLQLLYRPQVKTASVTVPITDGRLGRGPNAPIYEKAINRLTLALPAAEPSASKVGVRIYGDRDLGREWARTLSAAWIPADDGQGLLLTGNFTRPVTRLQVQVGYHSPLSMLSGAQGESAVIGGPRGIRFAISGTGQVTQLYADDPTPHLEACEFITLTPKQLTPKE